MTGADALLEGTREFDGAELTERFEQLGTAVESGADWDSAFIKLTVLADHLDKAASLLGEAIARADHLTRDGVREGLESVKRLPAASGHPGTTMGFVPELEHFKKVVTEGASCESDIASAARTLAVTERVCDEVVTLPLHSEMQPAHMDRVIEAVVGFAES